MASGKTLQTAIEISGVLSPSLQAAINGAVSKLSDMAEETLDSADAASRLVAEMSEQENVLNALKRAYAGYAVEGKESSEEAQKLAQKIEEVSGELSENKQKLDAAERAANSFGNELDEAEDKAEKASDGFTVMKGVLSNLVTKGLELAAEGVQKLYDSYMEFDNGADTIIAKTGATGEAAAGLQKVYKNVSKSVPGSFEDIGTAVGEINTRFGLTDGALEDLSVKFMKFAELNDTDVNSSVDNVQKALSAFGLDANDAGGVLDTLNKVGQDSGIAMDKLSTSLIENASSFSQMGLDIHQAAGFMGQIEKSGVTTEVAMTALGKASQFAAKENKPLTQMLEETTKKMANAKTDTEGLQVAYEVFGKKAGAKIYEACKTGSLSFDDLAKAMENNSGSIDATYEATQDGADKIKLALQGVKADAGEAIAGFLDEHKDGIVSTIETIAGGIKTITDNLPVVGVIIGGVTAAIAAFKIAAWSAKLATEGFTIATKLQAIAQGALNAIMNANPIGLIILAITALVAAFMILWKNCEGFRNFWINLWETIKTAAAAAWEWIKNVFSTAWGAIKQTFASFGTFFSGLWNGVKAVFAGVGSFFSGVFTGAWNSIKNIFGNIVSFFSGIWGKIVGIFKSIGVAIGNAISGAVKGAINRILSGAVKIINGFISAINFAIGIINAIPGVSINKITKLSVPALAAGGFTDGVSIAGEAGTEAVISFDPAYRDKNIGIWEKAGKMLGVLNSEQGLTATAGRLLALDDFSLGSLADGAGPVIYYDFSGFTWSPQIQTNGSDDEDSFMAKLKAHEAEFFDWLEEFIHMREEAQYA